MSLRAEVKVMCDICGTYISKRGLWRHKQAHEELGLKDIPIGEIN